MFETYSPQTLRKAIEIELQKTNDPKMAAVMAMKKLAKDPEFYDMMKAKPTKYIKRVPKPSGKGYYYFYTQSEIDNYEKEKKQKKKEKKAGWLDKFANFFGIKDRVIAVQKIKADYDNNQIKEKHNVSLDSWKNHLGEYFKNKEKWDNFFSGKKEKKEKKKAEKKEKAEKKKSLKKKDGIKLSVMKAVFGVYGGKVEKLRETGKPITITGYRNVQSSEKGTFGTFYNITPNKHVESRKVELNFKNPLILTEEQVKPFEGLTLEYLFHKWFGDVELREEVKKRNTDMVESGKIIDEMVTAEAIKRGYDSIISDNIEMVDLRDHPDNFDTMPEAKPETGIITDEARVQEIKNSIAEGELILKSGKKISGEKYTQEELVGIQKSVNNAKRKIGMPITLPIVPTGQTLPPNLQVVADKQKGYEVTDVTPEGFGPEEPETKEEKEEDKKVAKKINKVTPDNRNETEREIMGIPEPSPEEDIVTSAIEFSPKETSITIPFYKGGGPESFAAKDYTGVMPKDIYLVSDKKILTEDRPKYIPEMDEDFLRNSNYFVPTMKLGENKYIMQTHKEIRRGTSQPILGENKYVIVTRDVFAATQNYYLKLAKARKKKGYDDLETEHGVKQRRKRISMISTSRMSYAQSNFMRSFTGTVGTDWNLYTEIRNDLKQKTEDMEIQLEEYYNTHAKGRETAYGDKGLNNQLLDDYGVKVKRQNGSEINEVEIGEIQDVMNDLFSVFGNRSSMATNFGLKISHSGEKLMHARKAAGLFFPSMKAIGVTTKYGKGGTGFILAHEWGHFMDYYMGEKSNRHYISDDPESVAGNIADTFRKTMTKRQKSNYQNRTCECFARAMEQYWAIKTDSKEIMAEWDAGNHPSEETFKERIMPLIDQFFQENDKLLKAIFKIGNKFFRKVK